MSDAARFLLTVEVASQSNVPSDVLLRRALKCLGRSFGIRGLAINSAEAAKPAAPKRKRTAKSTTTKPPYDPITALSFGPALPGDLEETA